ncbi:glycosyltransferase family 39 protein [Paraglaciecola sp.]|uniref:ArnT family glycosyltransferase n=1 Tax=Paraglaciecola sp. TaxID=1920173 RepID=UPI00273E04BA|nr:glycosyltransferase family 39 protein [Paraglaciecola sp.]MDP5031695.1 glycosyltransferase family 39 protein [Paraglaciecola sp.]
MKQPLPYFNADFGQNHLSNMYWLFGLAVFMIFIGLGLRDPWPADEPRFAQIAMEMVHSGQWFFPSRAGELYPDKPPIFMWSIAFFYWLTGSINIAFLLPSALSGLVTMYLVYSLGRRLWSNRIGFYAAILLIFSVQFTLQAKTAQIDAMVCMWITLGCYGLLRFLLIDGLWRWYFMAWFFMGIGVITKGVGFLPLLMLFPFALLRGFKVQNSYIAAPQIEGGWRWWLGPLVMLGAISLWFLPMLLLVEHSQNPLFETYRDNILFKQTVKRYADSWHHIKPFYYYVTSVVPVFWLPISLLLPWLFSHWKLAFKERDFRIILPLVWVALVLVFFSVSPGKRGVYILPALPMLALVTAPYLAAVLKHKWPNRLLFLLVSFISVIMLLAALAGWMEIKAASKLVEKYQVEPWGFLATIGLTGLLIIALTWLKKPQLKLASWPLFIMALWIIYSTWGYALLGPVKTPKSVFDAMSDSVPSDAELALVDFSEQFILFSPYSITHFGYHTDNQEQVKAAWHWQGDDTKRFILIDENEVTLCFDPTKALDVGYAHRVHWLILGVESRLVQCAVPNDDVHQYHLAK